MKDREFLIKNLIITVIFYIIFRIGGYFHSKRFAPISLGDLKLFIFFFIAFIFLRSFLVLAQNVTGDLMEGSWSKRIIFIIVAIVMIYLYKSTGRI
ncbi:hypothetical protein F350042L8_01900 [Fusobacterium ulcerans]|uniref:hypothetical protein n=2 Tax=Fusobacterium ulcerans TaxID=861 RepID=UPI0034B06DDC